MKKLVSWSKLQEDKCCKLCSSAHCGAVVSNSVCFYITESILTKVVLSYDKRSFLFKLAAANIDT